MRLSEYDREAFLAWLIVRGAEIGPSTSRSELLRFWTHEGIGTVRLNRSNKVLLDGVAGAAYQAFRNNLPWKALPRPRDKRAERWQQWSLLAERDGPECCYCGGPLTFESYTLEHFLAKTHGGTNYYANLGLACEPCNRELGNLPIAQKIKIAIERRIKRETLSPKAHRNGQGPSDSPNSSGLRGHSLGTHGQAGSGQVAPGDGVRPAGPPHRKD